MFTGIIEEIGTVKNIQRGSKSVTLEIQASKVLEDTRVGDSIATNGVCLTVTRLTSFSFVADVMPETMQRSNLGKLKIGDRVNLERALCLNSRLGGHLVAGHVDDTGTITGFRQDEIAIWITISAPTHILRYIIEKGSITVDGVSLTVAYVDSSTFKVSIIPHTQEETTLTSKWVGEMVNLENDMIARYVEKLMGGEKQNGLTLDFLQANGF
ncbi:MAG: riboflavin synthase [Odoribacter sp.]|nr:riboflavin synthase [Odoribacter sp.]